MIRIFWLIITTLFLGCGATYNKNFHLVEKGMSLRQIEDLIGNPISAESGDADSKIMYYRLASSPLDSDGSDTREYYILLKDGKVMGYGERKDEITMQREIRQFRAAWNSVNSLNKTLEATTPQRVDVNIID